MKDSLYFYLEPYVYMQKGRNGILLVNFLDDLAFIFNDARSLEIAESLLSSDRRTAEITENDINQPLVVCARKNYLGDIVYSKLQPLQFYSEIDTISERKAYRKTVTYSKNNICSHISDCTVFLNSDHQDCNRYVSLKTGMNTATVKHFCEKPSRMPYKNIHEHTKYLCKLNPEIRFLFCGVDLDNLNYIIDNIPTDKYNFFFSSKTLKSVPQIQKLIEMYSINYTLMLNLSEGIVSACDLQSPNEIWASIQNEKELSVYYKLRQSSEKIKPFLIFNSQNTDFIKSTIMFSQNDILGLRKKYRIIKSNNLINTNYWGHIYIFPNGTFSYSLTDSTILNCIINLYNDFKQKFFSGDFDWTNIRNYEKCKDCFFKALCPSPSYIENILRGQTAIDCLIHGIS